MSIAIKDGSTWRYPRSIEVKDGGVWRTLKSISYKDGSSWRTTIYIASLVIGFNGTTIYGKFSGTGSLTPSTDCNSHTIDHLYYNTSNSTTFLGYGSGNLGEFTGFTQTNYIKRITVDGVAVDTSGASYFNIPAGDSYMNFQFSGDVFSLVSKSGQTVSAQFTSA